MITLYEFRVNFHVANENQSTDIEGILAKEGGSSNKFEVSIEVIDYKPDEDGVFVSDAAHNHHESFSADTPEEAMDTFTGLLNSLAMPSLAWSKDETLSGEEFVETKPDESD